MIVLPIRLADISPCDRPLVSEIENFTCNPSRWSLKKPFRTLEEAGTLYEIIYKIDFYCSSFLQNPTLEKAKTLLRIAGSLKTVTNTHVWMWKQLSQRSIGVMNRFEPYISEPTVLEFHQCQYGSTSSMIDPCPAEFGDRLVFSVKSKCHESYALYDKNLYVKNFADDLADTHDMISLFFDVSPASKSGVLANYIKNWISREMGNNTPVPIRISMKGEWAVYSKSSYTSFLEPLTSTDPQSIMLRREQRICEALKFLINFES